MNLILRFLISAVVFYLVLKFVPGFLPPTIWGAVVATVVFGLVNALLGTVLRILSFPLNWLTHGLFGLVINWLMFVITVRMLHLMNPATAHWWTNLLGAVIVTIVSTAMASADRQAAASS